MRPRLAGIDRFVDAVAVPYGIPERRFAAADEDDVWIRRSHGNRADRRCRLTVEDRRPHPAAVDGFPDTAIDRAEVEIVGATGYSGCRRHSPATEWSDHSPAQTGKEIRRNRRGENSMTQSLGSRVCFDQRSNQSVQVTRQDGECNSSAAGASHKIAARQQ